MVIGVAVAQGDDEFVTDREDGRDSLLYRIV
jgi:hypothetical protein